MSKTIITGDEPQRKPTQFDGRKALIKGDHPHTGETAECVGVESTNVGPGLVFKSDEDGQEFFVFKPENLKWL